MHRLIITIAIYLAYIVFAVSLLYCIMPWLGAGGYAFAIPYGSTSVGVVLPRLDIIDASSYRPETFLDWVYWTSEQPVIWLGDLMPSISPLLYFRNSHTIRPLVLSILWLIPVLTTFLTILIGRRLRRSFDLDRSKFICRCCGYDLRGNLNPDACPECGTATGIKAEEAEKGRRIYGAEE